MSQHNKKSNLAVISFIIVLSMACALILSVMVSLLKERQEIAKELDRSEQMLLAAKIMSSEGNFILLSDEGYVPAKVDGAGLLVVAEEKEKADPNDVLAMYRSRIRPILVDENGNRTTFKEAGIDEKQYTADFKKTGYGNQPLKLIYEVLPNSTTSKEPIGYVFPVAGFGLWDAIYGYLAIAPDGETILGISWYEHAETPGLGANITEESWQKQFTGKKIFQADPEGQVNYELAPIGITVVRGKVAEVIGTQPKAKSSVDGMAGATLTGNGVSKAYKETLEPYRPFLILLNQSNQAS